MLPNLRSGIAQLLRRKPIQIGSGRNMCTSSINAHEAERTGARVVEWMIRRGSIVFIGFMMSRGALGDVASLKERQWVEILEEKEKEMEKLEKISFG